MSDDLPNIKLKGMLQITPSLGAIHLGYLDRFCQPAKGQPYIWCHWRPTGDGDYLEWLCDFGQYFDYKEWLDYFISHFFTPWNYQLSGRMIGDCEFLRYSSRNDKENGI